MGSRSPSRHALTLDGAGMGATIIDGPLAGAGITVAANTSGVTYVKIIDLTVQEFDLGVVLVGDRRFNQVTFTDVASKQQQHVTASGLRAGARQERPHVHQSHRQQQRPSGQQQDSGIWIIDGAKTNVSITDGHFNNNNLVGIDLSDGTRNWSHDHRQRSRRQR